MKSWISTNWGSLSVAAIILMAALPAYATDVSGDQSGTWTLAGSPYVVTSWVNVPLGKTLTIQPGVMVRFNQSQGMTVYGTLYALGTATANITFTSNGTLAPEWWNSIQFRSGSGTMDYCKVMYAGYYEGGGIVMWGNSAPTISNSTISYIKNSGIRLWETATPSLINNTISNCTEYPVRSGTWSAIPTFQNNTFTNNVHHGVRLDSHSIPENQKITWNHPGTGNPYSVNWATVNGGATLTIPAGVIVKFDQTGHMGVYGTLNAQGTATNQIVFTALTDDSVGGDTDGDGGVTKPAAEYWNSIQFRSGAGTMDYCKVMYAGYYEGGGIVMWGNSAPTISNSTISYIKNSGIRLWETAKPALINNTISNCTEYPVRSGTWSAIPTFQNNTFTNNAHHGVRLDSHSIPENQKITWNHPGTGNPYSVNWATVSGGATLTIPAGVIVKFDQTGGMTTYGTLIAQGTAANQIVFTAMTDDSVGGDTDGDGDVTKPAADYWNSIQFRSGTGTMDYCKVMYAGYYDGGGIVMWGSSSPTISNSAISYIKNSGIRLWETAKPTLTNNTISNCTEWPVRIGAWGAIPTFQNNKFTSNAHHGVRLDGLSIPTNQQTTWNHPGPGNPYSIDWATVNTGAILNLPAGLILKFDMTGGITVYGTLNAKGTASDPIIFTAMTDDSVGGDTDGDGGATQPAPNYWNSVQFRSAAGTMDYCKVMYAGYYEGGGIVMWGNSSPTISNSEISNIQDSGVKLWEHANPVISPNNIIEKCSNYGVLNNGSITVNARNNWWGDATGPYHKTLNPGGKGVNVSDKVDFAPYLTTRPGGTTVTYEADVAPRSNGDGKLTIADWVQVGRFAAGLDTAASGSEFQRADCAPRVNSQGVKVLGDGRLTVSDWVQAGRYAAGLDSPEAAGGPTAPASQVTTEASAMNTAWIDVAESQQAITRSPRARVVSGEFNNGISVLTIAIDAQGTENALAFSLNFNAKALQYSEVILDGQATNGALIVNSERADMGTIGIVLSLPPGLALASGYQNLMRLHFVDLGGEWHAPVPIAFTDLPVQREISDVGGNGVPTIFLAPDKTGHLRDR